MIRTILKIIFLVIIIFILKPFKADAAESFARSIVVFKHDVSAVDKNKIIENYSGLWKKELKLINAAAVDLPSQALDLLRKNPNILRIDPDVEVFALDQKSILLKDLNLSDLISPKLQSVCDLYPRHPGCTPQIEVLSQTIPWGITRIAADQAWAVASGSGVKVAVIDTGIDRDHPDLQNNLTDCLNFIQARKTCEDDNGHGTHVSGIIAARNNNSGVVGAAPEASIAALKVLNRQGSGYLSDIIEALDWSIANGVKVVNMSLGTTSNVESFHQAVIRVRNAGIVEVAAAGNSGPGSDSVIYPARYPEVIAVSATSINDQVPSWSSRGPEVDLAAPGVEIYSTWLRAKYKTISGTSMAAPHVSGVVALRLSVKPNETPDQIETVLEENADYLPFDPTLVGSGLVNAYRVISAP